MRRRLAAVLPIALVVLASRSATAVPAESLAVKQTKVNGVELAYVEEGSGPAVVFVHGGSGDWRTWDPVRPFISRQYRYVALSRRYHYPNAWPDDGSNYSFDQHVEDLAAFIRGLHAGKVHLVGSSYSGRMAGYLAIRHPKLLRSVVLGEPGLIAADSPEGKAAAAIRKEFAAVVAAADSGDDNRAAILLFNAVMDDSDAFSKVSPARQRGWLDNAKTVRPMFESPDTEPLTCEELGTLKVPALVLGGERSRANFRLANDKLMTCLPKGTERAVIRGAPHIYAAASPEATAQAILRFVAKH